MHMTVDAYNIYIYIYHYSYRCPFAYLSIILFRQDDAEDALYSHILLNILLTFVFVRCSSTSRQAEGPSVNVETAGDLEHQDR